MEKIINIGVFLAFSVGMIQFVISLYVLHTYETETNKKPPSIQFWPYNNEIKKCFPSLTKLGRVLNTTIIILALPWLVSLIIK